MESSITVILCTTTERKNRRMVIYKIIPEADVFVLEVTPPDFAPEMTARFPTMESAREYVQQSVKTFHLEIISDELETNDGCGCVDCP